MAAKKKRTARNTPGKAGDDLALISDTSDDAELENVVSDQADTREREKAFLSGEHKFNGESLPDFGAVGVWMYWELTRLQGVKSSVGESFVVMFLLTENFKDWAYELDRDPDRRQTPRLAKLVNELTALGGVIFFQQHVLPWAMVNIVGKDLLEEAQEITKQITDDLFRVKAKARPSKKKTGQDSEGN